MRHAFTLVETLIACALGAAVCVAAYACLRLCTSSAATAARLSDENRLMRAGLIATLDELDAWNAYDDPHDAARQPLRAGADGAAFAPLSASAQDGEACDLDLRASEPKTWYRGSGFTGSWTWGHFGGEWGMHQHLHHPDPERAWHPALIKRLTETLGYYGLLDYAPASTLFSYYLDTGDWYGPFVIDTEFFEMGPSRPHHLYNANNWRWQVRDIGGITAGSAFSLTTNPAMRDAVARRFFFNFYDTSKMGPMPPDDVGWYTRGMYDACAEDVPLFGSGVVDGTVWPPRRVSRQPASWPAATARVRHFILSARWWNTAEVELVSPATGQHLRVWYSAVATTLRGARRQRGLDHLDDRIPR